MADAKISGLPASTTPLAGTEVLPVVQSSTTKQVSVANLTAGRAVSAASLSLTTTPLAATSGGTGQSSAFTANGVAYASSTSALTTGSGLRFDGTNLGLNVTPSAWASGTRAMQFSSLSMAWQQTNGDFNVGYNTIESAANSFVYKLGGIPAGRLAISDGLKYYNAVAGTNAGDPITFVQQIDVDSSGNIKANTGNFVQGTAAKGINFTANTPAAGMTSQLLNWYEEGTWTPTDASGAGLTFTVTYAKYVRVGKQVTVNMFITFPSTASAAQANIGGLPFNIASNNYPPVTLASNSGVALSGIAAAVTKTFAIGTAADYSSAVANSTLSGRNLVASLTYLVD